MKKNIAIVGCGVISDFYLTNLTGLFENTNVYAVCDLIESNAKEKAEKYQVERIMTLDEILADENVDIVLNLTTPHSHYGICKKALMAGKHVYVEKPLSVTYSQGKELVNLAREQGLLLGCAPDTFLGAGLQTCRKIIDDGLLGEIVGATAFMVAPGPESWHPNPAFLYQKGSGPMFDMGPYYLTALVNMLGNVKSVFGMNQMAKKQRKITSQPLYGTMIDVEVPTHVNGLLRFANGAVGNIITSFDVYGSVLPRIEVYGTRGSMIVPDPNTFGGTVSVKQYFDTEFKEYPLITAYSGQSRGIGVSDMADALIRGERTHKANGNLALHVLEIMEKIHTSGELHREMDLESCCERPERWSL